MNEISKVQTSPLTQPSEVKKKRTPKKVNTSKFIGKNCIYANWSMPRVGEAVEITIHDVL